MVVLGGAQSPRTPRDTATCPRCPALLLESPRWLLATQQLERARKTLQALAESSGRGADEQGSLMAGAWGRVLLGPPFPNRPCWGSVGLCRL